MPKKAVAEYVREIKRLNARFRKLKRRDGGIKKRYDPVAHLIAKRKDSLMNAMQAECRHPRAFESIGTPIVRPRRICCVCGRVRKWISFNLGFPTLNSADTIVLEHDAYLIEQGKLLKKLGFNL